MLQTVIVTLIVAGILVYVIRYYARVFKSETPGCSGCSGCCGAAAEKAAGNHFDGEDPCCEGGAAEKQG